MSFSEQIQRLSSGLSAEQVVDLRALIVEASERQHANPSVFSMSLQTLRQKLVYQGFDWDDLLGTLQQLAKGSLEATKQAAFAADCEMFMARDASIAEFASMLSADYSDLQKVLEQLVEAAQEDQRSLMAIAGGTSTWKATPNATKKQKSKKIGIDIAEVGALVVGLGLINRAGWKLAESRVGKTKVDYGHFKNPLIEEPEEARTFTWSGGERIRLMPGRFGATLQRVDGSDGDKILFEAKKYIPLQQPTQFVANWTKRGYYYAQSKLRTAEEDNSDTGDNNSERPSSVDLFESDSDFDHLALDINPRRISHLGEGYIESHDVLPSSLPRRNSERIIKRSNGDLDYNFSNVKQYANGYSESLATDVARDAAGEVSRATKEAVNDGVRAEDDVIEDMT